jgi:hypothetical protein
LADITGGGGAAEMVVVGEGDDVAEVLEGHGGSGAWVSRMPVRRARLHA